MKKPTKDLKPVQIKKGLSILTLEVGESLLLDGDVVVSVLAIEEGQIKFGINGKVPVLIRDKDDQEENA